MTALESGPNPTDTSAAPPSSSPPLRAPSVARLLWRLVRPVLLAYVLVVIMLTLLERWLVYPGGTSAAIDADAARESLEDVWISTPEARLHGWYAHHTTPRAVVLYCHGNGESVGQLGPLLRHLRDAMRVAVLAFDYRGYGRSSGSPTEGNTIADARAAQLWLASRAGCDPADVVLMGRSLGGGVAVALAADYPIRGLILERTFARLSDTAAHHFWWLPVRLLMRNQYDSLARIPHYRGPLLQSHGTHDEIIPFQQGQLLYQAATTPQKQFYEVRGGMHNDPQTPAYFVVLDQFLDRLDD